MGLSVTRGAGTVTAVFGSPQEIVISHTNDSIRIGDGTNLLTVNADGTLPVSSAVPQATIIDEASSTVTYIGKAAIGAATGSASWQIQRLTTSGGTITIAWADGDADYDNVWNNRASLSYS